MIPIDPNTIGGKSGGPSKFAQAGGVTAALDGVMQLGSAAAPIIKNIGMSTDERSNDRGHLTHEVNTGGNVLSMGMAGAKAGSMFGPWGTAIGAVGGALAGGVMSIIDKNKQPTLDELVAKNKSFNTQQHVKTIASNDTFIQQAQAAEDGLKNVNGTKKIEVEKDEIILRKVGKSFKKVADFTGGKSHSQGGEDYIAEQGDIIFPGKQRELVNRALRTRDWKRLESMRAALPPDTVQPQKADGVNSIETDPEKNRLATTKPIPESGTAKYTAIHIPKNDDPEKQADFRAAYAKRMGLSEQQVSGFLDQREADAQYYKDKSAFLSTHMKDWRANPRHSKFSMVSPEYRTAIEGGTKAWYDKNPRMVNDVVYDYYNNGPAVNNNIQKEFTSVNTSKEPIKYKEGTSGIDVYQDGTKGIQTDPPAEWTAESVQAFIEDHVVKGKKAPITGKKLLELAKKHDFPIELALIQGAVESNFGTKGAGSWTNNIFNWGNVTAGDSKTRDNALKDGDRKVMDTVSKGVETYMKGVKRNYLNPVDGDWRKLLDEGFVNEAGNRYATEPKYEEMLKNMEAKLPTYTADTGEERVQAMRDANIKKLGYEPYEDYSSRTIAEGGEPESEAWYEQNVIAPLQEDKRGYWTMDSPKGRANYDAENEGVHARTGEKVTGLLERKEANLEFKALSTKEKIDKLKELRISNPDDPNLEKLETLGYLDVKRGEFEKVLDAHFTKKSTLPASPMRDVTHTAGKIFGNWFNRDTQENIDNDYHGISDKKLKEEALAFRSYLGSNKDNGTWLGRKGHQAFNFLDRAVVAGLEGIESLDAGAQVSTGIANLLSGEDPEVVEKLINDAKAAGVLSEKGANYAWHIATDPEVFKNQTAEAVEDVNVMMAVKDAPRLIRKAWNGLPGAWKTAKGWAQAIKSGKLTKDGQLTAKGFRAIRNSKDLRMKLKAAKNAKNSTAAKNLEKQVNSLFGNSFEFKGTETFEEMEALAKQLDNIPTFSWKNSTREAVSFFNNQWKSIKNLPSKTIEKLGGRKFSEIADMEKQLSKITGRTPKELRAMSGSEVAKVVTETRKAKFQTLQDAIKAKDEAWKAYKPLKDNLATAKKAVEEAGATGKNLESLQEDVRLAEEALQQGAKSIEDLEKLTKTNWDQIGKIEAWEATPGIAQDFRQLVKGEQAIARHTENLKGLEGSLATAKSDQAVWKSIKTDAKVGESIIENAADAVRLRDEGLSAARSAQGKAMAAQNSVNTYENLAKTAPKLHAEIAKHADMMKTLKAGARFTPEMYNILRKGDGIDIPDIEGEDVVFTPEEIENAGKKREPVKSVISGRESQDGTGTYRIEGLEDVGSDIDPLAAKPVIGGDKVKGKGGTTIGKISGALDSLAEYAPAIYNITKGLEKPDKITRRFVTPQTKEYHNMSQPQLNAIDAAFEGAISNARNMSGGMMSNFRANTEAAWAEKIARTGAVNAHEAGRSDAIASENIGIRNQADQINTQTHQKADIMDMQSEAATNSFLAQGVSDVANISAVHRKDRNAEKNQNMVLKMMGEGRPFTAGEDGSIKFTG